MENHSGLNFTYLIEVILLSPITYLPLVQQDILGVQTS